LRWYSFTDGLNLGGDASEFAYIGRNWLEGIVPYRDINFHSPPGVLAINAMAFAIGGASVISIRIAAAIFTSLSIVATYLIGKKAYSKKVVL